MHVLIQSTIDGLLFGAIYAIAGITFGIIYNITKAFHIAFGSIGTLGVYVAVTLAGDNAGLVHVVVSVAVGVFASALATGIVVTTVYRPLARRGADSGAVFVSSLACGLLIQAVVMLGFGPDNRSFPVDDFVKRFDVATFGVSSFHAVSVLLAFAVVLGLNAMLNRTTFGHHIQAISSNRELAELAGIRTGLVVTVSCALAGGLSVIAVVLLGMNGAVVSAGGTQLALFAVLATIAGGAGGILGIAIVALGLGLLSGICGALVPGEWSTTVVFACTLGLILMRPFQLMQYHRHKRAAE